MKNFKNILLYGTIILSFIAILAPTITHAALDYSGWVQCDGVLDLKNEPGRNRVCDFTALMHTVNYLITWLFRISIPIFVGMLAYAGILYMKSPSSGDRSKANAMLWAGVKGFIIMLCAWVLVTTIVEWVIDPSLKGVAGSLLEQNK